MSSRLLLLDFDGVILKRHKLFDQIKARCYQYVDTYIGVRNPQKIKEVNDQLYSSYGHTVLGLQKLGYDASIKEFNHYVYDFLDYSKLKKIDYTDVQQLGDVIDYCDRRNVDLCITSNAPDTWVYNVLKAMSTDFTHLKTLSSITSQHLKPTNEYFETVNNKFESCQHLYCVDDKLVNLLPIASNPRYTPIMVSNYAQHNKYLWITSNMSMINDLSHVSDIIDNDIVHERPYEYFDELSC